MGANKTEYENSFRNNNAKDLKNNVDESKFGNAYQKRMSKVMLPGAMAPMVGMMGSKTLMDHSNTLSTAKDVVGSTDFANYSNMVLGAGSALGTIAAPLMYRSGTKQNASNASDMNDRTRALNKGNRLSSAERTDSILNAGTSVQKAGTGALATGYGATAVNTAMGGKAATGWGGLSADQALGFSKLSSGGTLGGAGVNSALMAQGQNPLAALTTDAAGKAGSVDYSELSGGLGGNMGGMAVMMAAMMAGGKLTKGIKNMANTKGDSKYKYRSASLSAPSPDRDLNKYNILGTSFGAQVNLLMMTDKLSPYENLALTALSAIASNTGAGPALYNFFTGKEDTGNYKLKTSHNKMSTLFSQEDEFSSLSGHTTARKKGAIEKIVDQYSNVMESIDRTILGITKGIQAGATAFNPLNVIFGGLFGPSAEKQISGLFGLDEESIRDNALERTAKTLNLPVAMVQIAETRADKVLKMAGDDPDSKKIAMLQLIAEINRNQLQLMLDEKKKDQGGFIGQAQSQFEIMDNKSGVEGSLKKFRGMVGNIPGLGLLASLFALNEARQKGKEENTRRLNDDFDYQQGRSDDSLTHQALANSFLGMEFPNLFLDSLDLDVERNILLAEIRNRLDSEARKKDPENFKSNRIQRPASYGAWDFVTGTIMEDQDVKKSQEGAFKKEKADIIEFFRLAAKKHPGEKGQIKERRDTELKKLNDKYGSEMSLQDGKDVEEKEKREKLLTTVLVKLEKSLGGSGKIAAGTATLAGSTKDMFSLMMQQFKGGESGKGIISGLKAVGLSILSVFSWAWRNKLKAAAAAFGLGYLGYLAYTNSPMVKKIVDGTSNFISSITGSQAMLALGAAGTVYGVSKLFGFLPGAKQVVAQSLFAIFDFVKKPKVKAGIAMALLGVIGHQVMKKYIEDGEGIMGSVKSNFFDSDNQEGEGAKTVGVIAASLNGIGAALMLVPAPHAKLVGLAFMAAGAAAGYAGSHWDEIQKSLNVGRGMIWDMFGSVASSILPAEWEDFSKENAANALLEAKPTPLETHKEEQRILEEYNKKQKALGNNTKRSIEESLSNSSAGFKEKLNTIIQKANANDDDTLSREEIKNANLKETLSDVLKELNTDRRKEILDMKNISTEDRAVLMQELGMDRTALVKVLSSVSASINKFNENADSNIAIISAVNANETKFIDPSTKANKIIKPK